MAVAAAAAAQFYRWIVSFTVSYCVRSVGCRPLSSAHLHSCSMKWATTWRAASIHSRIDEVHANAIYSTGNFHECARWVATKISPIYLCGGGMSSNEVRLMVADACQSSIFHAHSPPNDRSECSGREKKRKKIIHSKWFGARMVARFF